MFNIFKKKTKRRFKMESTLEREGGDTLFA